MSLLTNGTVILIYFLCIFITDALVAEGILTERCFLQISQTCQVTLEEVSVTMNVAKDSSFMFIYVCFVSIS